MMLDVNASKEKIVLQIQEEFEDTKGVIRIRISIGLDFLCLTPPLSAIFQPYHGDQL